ncbi:carboxypeptidase-like regulatory domain-containing protein [Hymenobacter jejuensis]|uniref:Carboxypeptidase-like regulatory domain-containing protein n=1 Tax=Hymenobacter jejuensis TaxID=2502781 RepID=A0A5B7ZXU8_9BACT|nr:carboxypeptidase-like regulatory domain-containing protein [Hymenobacter jejuensis]QDA59984.1 carboxypeptidase-like regulatory domain-containing protein [Hymenobacter jejuensis]
MPAAVHAQAPVEQRVPATKTDSNLVPLLTEEPIVLRGRVIDQQENQPLPGVTVLLKGTQIGVASGADGTFELAIPQEMRLAQGDDLVVVISSVGYERKEIPVKDFSSGTLLFALDSRALTGLTVVTVGSLIVYKPWPWHPRALWNRIRYAFSR